MTSPVKHTPGPWEAFFSGNVIEVRSRGPNKNVPAVVPWIGFDEGFRPKQEHKANARLIAAAPDLYEALEAVVELLDDNVMACGCDVCKPARETAFSALAKARGDTTP